MIKILIKYFLEYYEVVGEASDDVILHTLSIFDRGKGCMVTGQASEIGISLCCILVECGQVWNIN